MSRERLTQLQQKIAAVRRTVKRLGVTFVDDAVVRDSFKDLYRFWDDDVAGGVEEGPERATLDNALWSLWEKSEQIRTRRTACEAALKRAEDQCKALAKAHRRTGTKRASPPRFDSVIAHASLRENVRARWREVEICIEHGAHIAAVVMFGSIVEAVLLSRCKADPKAANSAKSTPKEANKVGKMKPKPLGQWKFAELIDVAEECGWLSKVEKDASHLLRDWRNLAHPNKQVENNIVVGDRESGLLVVLCRELLK